MGPRASMVLGREKTGRGGGSSSPSSLFHYCELRLGCFWGQQILRETNNRWWRGWPEMAYAGKLLRERERG